MEENGSEKWLTRRNIVIILFLVAAGGLLFRLYHLPEGVPLKWDALAFFWYASDVALLDSLPSSGHALANNGWPIFLSMFFQVMDSSNYMDYMLVQRLAGVALSVLTVIPVYLICRRFFPAKYALIGPAIFVFEPRVAIQSVIGYAEPLYVLLIAMSVACFLSERKRVIFATFPIIAAAAMVRGEAVALIVPYAILYGIRFRHSKKTAYEIPLLVILFMLILTPMITYRIDTFGTDGMFMRIFSTVDEINLDEGGKILEDSDSSLEEDISYIIRRFLYIMPIFVAFVPYGLYKIFKNIQMKNISIITLHSFMLTISLYLLSIYSVGRYTFLMIPIWMIFSVFSVKKLASIFSSRDLALVITVALVASSFILIGEYKKEDTQKIKDGTQISKTISKITEDRKYIAEAHHLPHVRLIGLDEFPVLINEAKINGGYIEYCSYNYPPNCDFVTDHAAVVADFIDDVKDEKISYLIIDDVEDRHAELLIHVFQNEDQYPYLVKLYDSRDDGFEYHVKIFEIDYESFDESRLYIIP